MENYKTMNTNENIPEILYVFQLYDDTPIGKIYRENFETTKTIKSAGIYNLLKDDYRNKFVNGDIEYVDILNNNFSNRLSKFGFENINNEFEVELERYRMKKYKTYPSRLSCIYAFGDYETCKLVSQIYKWSLDEIKEFKIINLHSACKVHMEIVSYLKGKMQNFSFEEIEKYYDKYWKGERIDKISIDNKMLSVSPIYEYLIEGEIKEV